MSRGDFGTIPELFEAQVRRTPEAVAVACGNSSITYAALDARANQLARHLESCGVGPEILVGVALDRTIDLITALLAILKAGGAYVPIDPSYPAQRIANVLDDAGARVVLTTEALRERLPASDIRAICLDREAGEIAAHSTEPARSRVQGHNLAYVIYTSGSTGQPKGVMVEHRNVISFFAAMDQVLGPGTGVWLAVTSISFDISVLELFWTLASGFRVILHGDQGPQSIPAELLEHQVTHLQCTPSLARMLTLDPGSVNAFRPLRKLLLGGEALPASLARQLGNVVSGEILNMYGPTETTIWSTCYRLGEFTTNVPIGRPLSNTYVRVLDAELRPVAGGEHGELFIGGAGVVRGYWNRPELSAERFIADPLEEKARLYRTGDLVSFRGDGELEFLGRLDFQVKIRGFRIELGEIEAALEARPGVSQAVVAAREDRPGDQRLVAYLVCDAGQHVEAAALRAALAQLLPEPMVPSAFVFLDAMPLTANGKIDRNALQVTPPPANPVHAAGDSTPHGDIERTISEVWAEALGVDGVGLDDNFFDLGAHSLLVAEVHGRLHELLQRELSLIELFRYPTVRSLASHLNGTDGPRRAQGSAERAARRSAARQNRARSR